jgi:hypothetical protein
LAQPKGTINGRPIDDKVFAYPDRRNLELRFEAKNHHPVTAADKPEIDAEIQTMRCAYLSHVIEDTLRDDQMKTLAVAITQSDLDRLQQAMESPSATYQRGHAQMVAMQQAIDAINKGEDPAAVHARLVKPYMTFQQWESMRLSEGNPTGGVEVRPFRGDERLTSVRQNENELQAAAHVRVAEHLQSAPLERVMRTRDGHPFWKVLMVGSV